MLHIPHCWKCHVTAHMYIDMADEVEKNKHGDQLHAHCAGYSSHTFCISGSKFSKDGSI